jgi:hypothetical protein
MGKLRTANKRHKRAVIALRAHNKPGKVEPVASGKPAKAAH